MWMIALALAATNPCANANTQLAMNQCAAAEYKQADAGMTRQWNVNYAAMKRRDGQDRSRGGGFGHAAALLESQRAWLKFRDTHCVVEGGFYAGGSMQGMVITQCKTKMTRTRTAQLRELAAPR